MMEALRGCPGADGEQERPGEERMNGEKYGI